MYSIVVEDVSVCEDGTVFIFFTDNSKFEYVPSTRLWKEVNQGIDLKSALL